MNFTYLVDGADDPRQELLQRFKHYVVVVVLTDDMIEFVLDKVGFDMRASETALFWVVQPKQLRQAPPSSALGKLNALVAANKIHSQIEHSFIATASRDDLQAAERNTGMIEALNLHVTDDATERTMKLKNAVTRALDRAAPPKNSEIGDRVQLVVTATEIVKAIFTISL